MLGVDPEIINLAATPGDEGDLVLAIPHGGQRVAVALIGRSAEPRQGARGLRLDPGERGGAVYVFQPEVGVVVGRMLA